MTTVAITGAGGFIGSALCDHCEANGVKPLRLMRRARPGIASIDWKIGEPLPSDCAGVDAVIHLASAVIASKGGTDAAYHLDVAGSKVLIDSVRALRRDGAQPRFIFVSSQSARPQAANAYGRSKWAIEQMVSDDGETIVRPGLVYGDGATSVFALFRRLTQLPAIPVVASNAAIQPIHVDELAQALIRISTAVQLPTVLQLGAINPMTLAETIVATSARANRSAPMMVSIPPFLVRAAASCIDRVFRPQPAIRERIDGLIGLQPMETQSSLALLGLDLRPFGKAVHDR